jgi:ornithine cyclodeaminase/alanine dehydrogenase-like protein (mu-crystallin family)
VKVLIVNQAEIASLLPMERCMTVMADALRALSQGNAILPLRPIMWLPEHVGLLGMMPAYLGSIPIMGLKVISVFPGNHGTPLDTHQGAVLLFDPQQGRLLAMMDASEITAIRTAAVSGVATQYLAREDAQTLALLGSGRQARTHLEAMLSARPFRLIRVWSRTPVHAQAFAERESQRHEIPIEPVATAQVAVEGADVVCTTTASREPVLHGEWLAEGTHINAVGSSMSSARELNASAVHRSRLYVDRRESALHEAGDFLLAKAEGVIGDDHIQGELGEVLLGRVRGRTTGNEITLFKSLGLAIEDLAAAHYVYTQALAMGKGISVEFGGEHTEVA